MANGTITWEATLNDKISPALSKIQQNTQKVNSAFAGLKTALAGLAIGSLIQASLRYADAIRLGCLYKQHGLSKEEFLATVNMIASPDSDYRRGLWDPEKLWSVSYPTMSTIRAKQFLIDLNCRKIPWI